MGDDALRLRVESLLVEYQRLGSFMDVPTTLNQPRQERVGTQIGPYKLQQQIGEGGMGVVYMAEQSEPVKRKVALKLIKLGMDSRQVIARFEAERQALAMMDHVNIARVLDAGTIGLSIDDFQFSIDGKPPAQSAIENQKSKIGNIGRPYFVMELIYGVPITKYCDDNHLTPRERLELFVPVCQAIQHAHQKGIIHRDIKPSNVMVTLYDGKPVPKVIDFGVAKATEQKLTERTLFTQYGTMVGTLEYMSPEQAEMSALGVDTRSDIYSLGVLLYELLTGSTPLSQKRMKEAGYAEILRLIKEEEPPRPSTRLTESGAALASISAQRQMDPAKLSQLMRGELDWIVMKTLEKDRNRRYETANGFAADVQRYLNDEPVLACPPSTSYRLWKFARRNKRALTTMTLLGLMLLVAVGAVAGSIGWVTRDRAARQMVIEQAVVRALEESDKFQQQGKWQEALVAVERAQAALASGEGGAELQQRVGGQLADLHMIQRLEQLRIQRGMDLHGHERHRLAYARAFTDFGIDVENLSPPDVAARIRSRPSTAVRLAAALDDWAIVLRDWGLRDKTRDPATWKRLLEAARLADPDPWRSQLRQLMGQEDLNALRKLADASDIAALPVQSLQLMGNALIFGGDRLACVAWLRSAHRQHPADSLITFDLAFHLSNLPSADWLEILRFAEAGLAARQSPDMYCFVGHALTKLGRLDEALAFYRTAIGLQPDYADAHAKLGFALSENGRLDEAIVAYRRVIELKPADSSAHGRLSVALMAAGQTQEAEKSYQKLLDLVPKSPADHNELAWLLATCPEPKFRSPKHAVGLARKAVELVPSEGSFWNTLGVTHYRNGEWKDAIDALKKSKELLKGRQFSFNAFFLAMANWQLDNKDEARKWYAQAVKSMDTNMPKNQELLQFRAEAEGLMKNETADP